MKPITPVRVGVEFARHLLGSPSAFAYHLWRAIVRFGNGGADNGNEAPLIDRALSSYFHEPPNTLLASQFLEDVLPDIKHVGAPAIPDACGENELPNAEYVTVARLVRYLRPRTVFEVGTYKGRTTRLLADHAPADAVAYTLDLPPDRILDGGVFHERDAKLLGERVKAYAGSSCVVQLFGDSRSFDFSPYYGRIDVVFIDGDHSYETVLSDSRHAFQMVTAGGIIVWDDYHPVYGLGVMRALSELSQARRIVWIRGTRLALYCNGEVDGSTRVSSETNGHTAAHT